MLIGLVEAFTRLNFWREAKTSLEVHVSLVGVWADIWGTVREVKGTIVEIGSDAGTLRLELREAFFDWRDDFPSPSHFTTCLLAEFRNGDKFLFSSLREVK